MISESQVSALWVAFATLFGLFLLGYFLSRQKGSRLFKSKGAPLFALLFAEIAFLITTGFSSDSNLSVKIFLVLGIIITLGAMIRRAKT